MNKNNNDKNSWLGIFFILVSFAFVFLLLWFSENKESLETDVKGTGAGIKFQTKASKIELVEEVRQKDEQIIALEAALKMQRNQNKLLKIALKSSNKADLLKNFEEEEVEKDYPKATPEEMSKKIKWRHGKEKLERIFMLLTIGNSTVSPLLTKVEVMEFLHNNFSCYDHKPTGRIFCPVYHYKYTLEAFIFQVYKNYHNRRGDKTVYANLLINNFEQFQGKNLKSIKVNFSRSLQERNNNSPYILWINDKRA